MLFRVVMITTLLLVAALGEAVSETLLPVNPLYFLIARHLRADDPARRWRCACGSRRRALVYVQVVATC